MAATACLLPPGKAMSNFERDPGRGQEEHLDPHDFYAAYVFDQAHERNGDVATLIEQAQGLGYPVRYWWLSDTMDLCGHPNRLIVCVHHPSMDEDAGLDLYEALKDQQVSWDALEAAAVGEYRLFGNPVEAPESIRRPKGTPLFPCGDPEDCPNPGEEKASLG